MNLNFSKNISLLILMAISISLLSCHASKQGANISSKSHRTTPTAFEEKLPPVYQKAHYAMLEDDYLEVIGRGNSGKAEDKTIAQKRALAEEAAIGVGYIRLAETLGELAITEEKIIKEQELVKDCAIITLKNFVLRYARQVGRTIFKTHEDGSIEATVTMVIPLRPMREIVTDIIENDLRENPPDAAYSSEEVEKIQNQYAEAIKQVKSLESGIQELKQQAITLQQQLEAKEEITETQKKVIENQTRQLEDYNSQALGLLNQLLSRTAPVDSLLSAMQELQQQVTTIRKQLAEEDLTENQKKQLSEYTERTSALLKQFDKIAKEMSTTQKAVDTTAQRILEKLNLQELVHEETVQDILKHDYTGLIVDARGTGLLRGIAPKIYTEQGKELYGYSRFKEENQHIWKEQGLVKYVNELAEAEKILGAPALTVKALAVTGKLKSSIILSNDDAVKIVVANVKTSFLELGRVVVVID